MPDMFCLIDAAEAPGPVGLSRLGGVPPSLGDQPWPVIEDGTPMVHLVSIDLLGGADLVAPRRVVSVFAKSLNDIERFDIEDDDPLDVVIRWSDGRQDDVVAPDSTQVLPCHAVEFSAPFQIHEVDGVVQVRFDGEVVAEAPVDEAGVAEARFWAVCEAIGNEGGANVSYLGGPAVNPGYGPRPHGPEGRFIARFAEHLFGFAGVDVNFAGGGWLFAFSEDGWVEQ